MRKSIFKKLIVLTITAITILGSTTIGANALDESEKLKRWNNSWIGNENGSWSYIVDGKRLTGLQTINDSIYYFDNEGYIAKGWVKLGNEWIYSLGDSVTPIVKGWNIVDGKWYYFNENGIMAHDTYVGNYYLGSDGAWVR